VAKIKGMVKVSRGKEDGNDSVTIEVRPDLAGSTLMVTNRLLWY